MASLFVLAGLLAGGVVIYAHWRFSQIHKDHVAGLVPRQGNAPFDVLLVGSDSRAFVQDAAQVAAFGSAAAQGGQRSDVIIVARIVPAEHAVRLLSIPRDTYLDIPGKVANISGPNRINAAFNNGPSLLVQTIEQSFHIPISDFAEVNFPGFAGMVNALGGINLDFAYPVKDAYSGLNITQTGCQVVMGTQALGLVRSRHLYYYSNGTWLEDYGSDWSRIQRQDAFFRALVGKLKGLTTSPLGINGFLGAATRYVTIDQTMSEGDLLGLAGVFRGFSSNALVTETLPTIPYTTGGGAAVLLPAQVPDEQTIKSFLAFGSLASTTAYHPRHAELANGLNVQLVSSTSPNTALPTVTTVPTSAPVSSSGVVYNTTPEPWNPVPCSR